MLIDHKFKIVVDNFLIDDTIRMGKRKLRGYLLQYETKSS